MYKHIYWLCRVHTHDAFLWVVLQNADLRVAERVGVSRGHLQRLVQSGKRRNMSEADVEKERICKRFFMALMLNDVIQEVSDYNCLFPRFYNVTNCVCTFFGLLVVLCTVLHCIFFLKLMT